MESAPTTAGGPNIGDNPARCRGRFHIDPNIGIIRLSESIGRIWNPPLRLCGEKGLVIRLRLIETCLGEVYDIIFHADFSFIL